MRIRLTARARLTALYTALFLACGAVLIVVTTALLSQNLPTVSATTSSQVVQKQIETCEHQGNRTLQPVPPDTKKKCEALYANGVQAGIQAQRDATLGNLVLYSLITLGCVTVLAALLGWIVAGRILHPVRQLTDAAREASEHDLSVRLSLRGRHDELRELADTFDDMLDRLDRAFNAQRQFIANASHELRTPLTVMRTAMDVVLAKPRPTRRELEAMCRQVQSAVDEADRLIDALLTLARNEHPSTVAEHVDLATVVEDILDDRPMTDVAVTSDLADAPVVGDRVLLERLVGNLVDNAMRYNVPGGWIALATFVDEPSSDGGRSAVLRVTNPGPQVPPDDVERLFQPFTRLDDRTRHDGFGLGLALVRSIAERHGGTVTAAARGAGGLEVVVRLPAVAVPSAEPALP